MSLQPFTSEGSAAMSKSAQSIMLTGIIGAALAVAFGAFGAHAPKQILSADGLRIYHIAVNYHLWHSIALIAIGLTFQAVHPSQLLKASAWVMVAGILLFSGSLYLLSLTGLRWFGMITPVGGLCFLVAWILFAIAVYKLPTTNS